MEAASLATSVPVIPIANPTSAFLSAGASLVPSPVTATIHPLSLSPVTKAYLSSGLERAKTINLSFILSNYYPFFIVSTLKGFFSASAVFRSRAQSHTAILHVLHTTPPMREIKSWPYITILSSFSLIIPTSLAIAFAVIRLSPVTILTVIPALWHF